MKSLFAIVALISLVAAVGCSKSEPQTPAVTANAPDKPRQPADAKPVVAKKPIVAEKPIAGEADKTFSLSVPFDSIELTQGEQQAVLIGINRGTDFRERVAIEVTGLPAGVTLETADPVIEHGSSDVTLMFKAAADASLGDFTVKVTGRTSSSGADFTKEFKVIVAQK
ncbi:MAG: hypothetical protein RIC55_23780 [Pirellulaceae bacterium]